MVVDFERRRTFQSTPAAVELSFGMREQPPLRVELRDGRTLAFRGLIDRVDSTPGGLVVFDYKAGKSSSFPKVSSNESVFTARDRSTLIRTPSSRRRYERYRASVSVTALAAATKS